MIGSLHLGLQDDSLVLGKSEEDLIAHLASMVSACFKMAVTREQVSQLILLDPLTQISNLRGFEKDIARICSNSTIIKGFGEYKSGGRETIAQIGAWLQSIHIK